MRELYGDQILELQELAGLLQHPENFGCTFDRDRSSKAMQIADSVLSATPTSPKR